MQEKCDDGDACRDALTYLVIPKYVPFGTKIYIDGSGEKSHF